LDSDRTTLLTTPDGPISGLRIDGDSLSAAYAEAARRSLGADEWPFILGPSPADAQAMLAEAWPADASGPSQLVAAASRIEVSDLINRWLAGLYADDHSKVDIAGVWPDDDADLRNGPGIDDLQPWVGPVAQIAFVPTSRSWEVPAWIRWGDWNACPPPAEHVAILHSWHDRYGAELVAATADQLWLTVADPPTSRVQVEPLAEEHFAYCSDLTQQGLGTIADYASAIAGCSMWVFWWD
jgi:hypothetical protein